MELRRQEELKQKEELRRQEEVQRRMDEQMRWQRQQVRQRCRVPDLHRNGLVIGRLQLHFCHIPKCSFVNEMPLATIH